MGRVMRRLHCVAGSDGVNAAWYAAKGQDARDRPAVAGAQNSSSGGGGGTARSPCSGGRGTSTGWVASRANRVLRFVAKKMCHNCVL
eukprot:SAG11_NODE_798_length_7127_cov_8.227803_8_plen_87_part_00